MRHSVIMKSFCCLKITVFCVPHNRILDCGHSVENNVDIIDKDWNLMQHFYEITPFSTKSLNIFQASATGFHQSSKHPENLDRIPKWCLPSGLRDHEFRDDFNIWINKLLFIFTIQNVRTLAKCLKLASEHNLNRMHKLSKWIINAEEKLWKLLGKCIKFHLPLDLMITIILSTFLNL